MVRPNTKKAFLCLLATCCYVAALFIFWYLVSLDFVLTVDLLRVLVLCPAVLLLICAPFVVTCLGIAGFVYAIKALRAGESKVKNRTMMVISVCVAILAILAGIFMFLAGRYA